MSPRLKMFLLLAPSVGVFLLLLVLPMANLFQESLRVYVPGSVGSFTDAAFTLSNYVEILKPAYVHYFIDTFRIGLFATLIGLGIGFPVAHYVARQPSGIKRKLCVAFLIAMMFLNVLVRVYSIALTFGTVGFLRQFVIDTGFNPNSAAVSEFLVILGLLHYLVPISALTLIGTIQNINPRLVEAAQVLGASRMGAHLSITVPLSVNGILSAFLICYTLCLSAFVIPLILGKGQIIFVSNLIYSRFSDVGNYPSGAALAVVLLFLSVVVVYLLNRTAIKRWGVN